MQLATSYMNLALPSSVARMAVSVRFFQRQGVAPAIAVTSGVIDSFTNTFVQVILLVLLLVFSSATLTLDLSSPSSSDVTHLLILLIGLLVLVILAVVLLPVGRRAIRALRERVAHWWPEVRGTFASLRGSHKLGELVLGNVATEVLFATSLGLFARGLGFPALARRPARHQHERVALRDLHSRAGRDRRRRGRAARRTHIGRRPRVGRVRDHDSLPHHDVLPTPDLGVVRAQLAAARTATSSAMGAGHRHTGVEQVAALRIRSRRPQLEHCPQQGGIMAIGPVDVYIIGFPGNRFSGRITPAIMELVENGTIRILDLLFVMKDADGVVTTVAAANLDEDGADFLRIDVTQPGALGPEDAEEVADDLPSNSSALLVAFENLWLARMVDALQAADAVVIDSIRIPAEVVQAALAAG